MAVPNDFPIVQAVWDRGGWDISTHEGIGTFTEASARELHAKDRRWGHLKKNPGQSQFHGHAVNAVLYLSDTPGQSTAVDIMRMDDPTITGPRWLVDVPRYSPSDWFPPEAPAASGTALGASLFWAHAGVGQYREQLDENLQYLIEDVGVSNVRWFFTVGGDLFSGADPWELCGAFFDDPNHEAIAQQTLSLLMAVGLKSHMVLVGSRAQAATDEQRNAIVDRAARLINRAPQAFLCVEMWNEYQVNGAASHDLRNMARRLRGQVPAGFPIALSSPNSVMGGNAPASEVLAEIDKMYGGDSGGNVLTEHNTRPEPRWNPETLRQIGVTLPILCGEPRGPGASAGGDTTNPAHMDQDFAASQRAGAIGYVYHTRPGIWGGHCHPQWPQENSPANIWEVQNSVQIAATLNARASGGGGIPIPIPPSPQPPLPAGTLLSGQALLPEQTLVSPGGDAHLHYQNDGNLVVYLEGVPIWASQTAGTSAGSLQMQTDGNLVLYSAEGPIRATQTWGHPGAMVQLQDDGNFVVYEDPNGPQAGTPLWASASDEFSA